MNDDNQDLYPGKMEIVESPELSNWKCHLFGGTDSHGITYTPIKGKVPNWFIRWMMKICLGCKWVKVE